MRIAYLILAHDQPQMFGKLANALSDRHASLFAHIDAKADEALFRDASRLTEVAFVKERLRVSWGGFSQTASMLKLLQTAHGAEPADYYIFLSGRDYPIRSNTEIISHLSSSAGRSYMNFYPLVDGAKYVERVRTYCYHDLYARLGWRPLQLAAKKLVHMAHFAFPDRKFFQGTLPYRGSSSWCLSSDIVDYILAFVADPANREFLLFFKSVSCSDEMLFQSIVLNSPLASSLHGYEEDFMNRPLGEMKNENKVYLHYIDWNPAREDPAILDLTDLENLISSGRFFARKFDFIKSAGLIQVIDEFRNPHHV